MKILLTVPHAICPGNDENDENDEHPCDFKAEEMALILKDNLEFKGHQVNLELGDTLRAICDLNRKRCRKTKFRQRIREEFLDSNDSNNRNLLLDVHSYPDSDETYGQFEFVILDAQILKSEISYYLWIYLLSKGINVGLLQGKDNDIQDESREFGFATVLLEFNEDLPLSRNKYIIKMISEFFI